MTRQLREEEKFMMEMTRQMREDEIKGELTRHIREKMGVVNSMNSINEISFDDDVTSEEVSQKQEKEKA